MPYKNSKLDEKWRGWLNTFGGADFPSVLFEVRCAKCGIEFGDHADDVSYREGNGMCDGFSEDDFAEEVEKVRRDAQA